MVKVKSALKTENIIINEQFLSEQKRGFYLPLSVGEYFSLAVQDSGPGISREVQDRMFEPFYTTKAFNQGTGMGLHIIRDIVRRLGGSIRVNSANHGTIFQILLPLWQRQEEAIIDSSDSLRKQSADQADVHAVTRPTVLYVEDEDSIRRRGSFILSQFGCTVWECASAEEALELIESGKVRELNLILTDYFLPGMSGLDLALKIRKSHPDTPIVLCSGREDLIQHLDWTRASVSEFYSKPMGTRDFAKLLRYCITEEQ